MATVATTSRLTQRWPTGLGLVIASVVAVVILEIDVYDDFVPGIAAMMAIYLAAYAIGKPTAAWPAFAMVIVVAVVLDVLAIEGAAGMVAVLGLLWLWVLVRGRARDAPWFSIETGGLLVFGGLTIAAAIADGRLAGVLAGVGWFTHGLWDAYHFAKDRVVDRRWSELCAVVDIPVGTLLVVASLAR